MNTGLTVTGAAVKIGCTIAGGRIPAERTAVDSGNIYATPSATLFGPTKNRIATAATTSHIHEGSEENKLGEGASAAFTPVDASGIFASEIPEAATTPALAAVCVATATGSALCTGVCCPLKAII